MFINYISSLLVFLPVSHNGIVAEDSETVSDQMQLPVQSSPPDEVGPGPAETVEDVQAEASKAEQPTVSASDAPLEGRCPADVPAAPAEEQRDVLAALEPTDTTAAGTSLAVEPASDLTTAPEPEPAELTAAPDVPSDVSSEPTLEQADAAPEAAPVEPAAVQEPVPVELPSSVESTPAPETTPVEPDPNVESAPPAPPELAPVELSPVPDLTVSEPVTSAEPAPAEDPTVRPEPVAVEPSPAPEAAPEEPGQAQATEAAAIAQSVEENVTCADAPTPAAQAADAPKGNAWEHGQFSSRHCLGTVIQKWALINSTVHICSNSLYFQMLFLIGLGQSIRLQDAWEVKQSTGHYTYCSKAVHN